MIEKEFAEKYNLRIISNNCTNCRYYHIGRCYNLELNFSIPVNRTTICNKYKRKL